MNGNEMKCLFLVPVIASTIFVGVANAASVEIDIPNDIQVPSSTLSRAEVIADLQVRRLAGLLDLDWGEASADTSSYQYKRAVATYQYLRTSPQFAVLVQELQENPNTTVVARRTSGTFAQSSN